MEMGIRIWNESAMNRVAVCCCCKGGADFGAVFLRLRRWE